MTGRNTVSLFADTGRVERRVNTSHVFMTQWDPSTAGSEGMLLPFRKLIKVVPRTREEDGDQSVPHQHLQLSRQFINNFTHFTFKSRSMSIFYGFPCSGSFAHRFPTGCKGICDNDIWGVLKPEVPVRQEKHRPLWARRKNVLWPVNILHSCPRWQRSQSVAATCVFLEMVIHKVKSYFCWVKIFTMYTACSWPGEGCEMEIYSVSFSASHRPPICHCFWFRSCIICFSYVPNKKGLFSPTVWGGPARQ